MPHILACVWFLLHQPSAQEGSIKTEAKKILLWQVTLIQGFRLQDIVLQIEMNTQLRERVNRNTANLPPTLMCNICTTDDAVLPLSL